MFEFTEVADGTPLVNDGAIKKGVAAVTDFQTAVGAEAFGVVELSKLLIVPEAA